jgi:hypothetical protein
MGASRLQSSAKICRPKPHQKANKRTQTGLPYPEDATIASHRLMSVREPPSPDTEERVIAELRGLRKLGFADQRDQLYRFELLVTLARAVGNGTTDLERVELLLVYGAGQTGRVFGPSLLALLGVSPEARGKDVSERHLLAYEAFCEAERKLSAPKNPRPPAEATFMSHTETKMLEGLAKLLARISKESIERRIRDRQLADGDPLFHTRDDKGAAKYGRTMETNQ